MRYLEYVKHRIVYDSFPRLVLDILGVMGIEIQPFYLFVEGLYEGIEAQFENKFKDYALRFLGPDDIERIASLPERNFPKHIMLTRLQEGNICLGLEYQGNLAAFTWCDVKNCDYDGYRFPLKEDEAYLLDAHTLLSYRGKGIAPFLRYQLYKWLASSGRTKLYSISERFNKPAIRFKEKLNARIVDKGIYVRLFKRWKFGL